MRGFTSRLSHARSDPPAGDDMAALPPSTLWTVDTLMDGVDFDSRHQDWRQIGHKALAVSLSDCAAMGATPTGALLSLVLSARLTAEDARRIFDGVQACGESFACPLLGGDTNSWDQPTVISTVVAARMASGSAPVRRSGARPGDTIFVTGKLGGSIRGRHLHPAPRLKAGGWLAAHVPPSAMIDISDGLAIDLDRIAEASGCGCVIEAAQLARVIHPDAEALSRETGRPALQHALSDGEDFELIVILSPHQLAALEHADAPQLERIGRCVAAPGLFLQEAGGEPAPLQASGWEHFR